MNGPDHTRSIKQHADMVRICITAGESAMAGAHASMAWSHAEHAIYGCDSLTTRRACYCATTDTTIEFVNVA